MMKNFISRMRELKGEMSQEKFAEQIGTEREWVAKLFSASPQKDIMYTTFKKIADNLGVSLDYLSGKSDIK